MSLDKQEYIMIGVHLQELPFDYFAEEYKQYQEGRPNETLFMTKVSDSKSGFVIGRLLITTDCDCGTNLTVISEVDNMSQIRKELVFEIKEKLGLNINVNDIHLYIFSIWL